MYQKILGGLIGAAAGDAMGAATETRTRKQIEEKFGGYVTDFLAPPDDTEEAKQARSQTISVLRI